MYCPGHVGLKGHTRPSFSQTGKPRPDTVRQPEVLMDVLSRTCWTQGITDGHHLHRLFADCRWVAWTCPKSPFWIRWLSMGGLDRSQVDIFYSLNVDGCLGHVPSRHFRFADYRWVFWACPKSTFMTRWSSMGVMDHTTDKSAKAGGLSLIHISEPTRPP